jgi:hypothetical protein
MEPVKQKPGDAVCPKRTARSISRRLNPIIESSRIEDTDQADAQSHRGQQDNVGHFSGAMISMGFPLRHEHADEQWSQQLFKAEKTEPYSVPNTPGRNTDTVDHPSNIHPLPLPEQRSGCHQTEAPALSRRHMMPNSRL